MTTPYGGNDPQQWGQQPYGGGGYPSQGQPGEQQWGQQPGQPQSGPQPQQYPPSGPQPQQPAPDQWGQQQQWGQQPAQPQYEQSWQQPQQQYQQPTGYPGYGQYPGFEGEGGGKKSKTWLWIMLAVVVLVVGAVAVLGFWKPGFFNTKVLDGQSVEQGVVQILGKDPTKVENVSCPDDIKVENGATAECTATINGEPKKVPITVTDADADPPEYRVENPK